MKKLISILFLFVFSLFIANSQSTIMYGDSLKSVTVNVSTDTKKQASITDNLQLQLTKVVDNQTIVNTGLSNGIAQLVSGLNVYTTEIEKRNKSDGQLITDKFNYTPQEVKKVMRTERWLNLITIILCTFYLLYVNRELSIRDTYEHILTRGLVHIILGVIIYIVLLNLFTLIFNGQYYVIKELINLYT